MCINVQAYPYFHISAEGHIENVNLGDNFNFYMVQGLHAGTEYTITINPIFVDIEGPVTAFKAKTCKYYEGCSHRTHACFPKQLDGADTMEPGFQYMLLNSCGH